MNGGASQAGFSLAETALSLAIVGLVIAVMVPGLLSLQASESARATQTALEGVARAAAAFVQANGCFPCPTPATLANKPGFGVVRGDTSATPAACAGCSTAVGLVPFRSLGLPPSFANDGYGRFLTFAVDSALTDSGLASLACQTVDSDCTADDVAHSAHKKGLCRAGLPATNRLQVALPNSGQQQAAFLVLSHGANGRGAFSKALSISTHHAFPASQPVCSPGSTGAERCNADEDLVFVASTPVGGADSFDDQMLYFDRNALMASLGGPACQTSW